MQIYFVEMNIGSGIRKAHTAFHAVTAAKSFKALNVPHLKMKTENDGT